MYRNVLLVRQCCRTRHFFTVFVHFLNFYAYHSQKKVFTRATPRVSAVLATATWLGGWLGGWLKVTRRYCWYCINTAKILKPY